MSSVVVAAPHGELRRAREHHHPLDRRARRGDLPVGRHLPAGERRSGARSETPPPAVRAASKPASSCAAARSAGPARSARSPARRSGWGPRGWSTGRIRLRRAAASVPSGIAAGRELVGVGEGRDHRRRGGRRGTTAPQPHDGEHDRHDGHGRRRARPRPGAAATSARRRAWASRCARGPVTVGTSAPGDARRRPVRVRSGGRRIGDAAARHRRPDRRHGRPSGPVAVVAPDGGRRGVGRGPTDGRRRAPGRGQRPVRQQRQRRRSARRRRPGRSRRDDGRWPRRDARAGPVRAGSVAHPATPPGPADPADAAPPPTRPPATTSSAPRAATVRGSGRHDGGHPELAVHERPEQRRPREPADQPVATRSRRRRDPGVGQGARRAARRAPRSGRAAGPRARPASTTPTSRRRAAGSRPARRRRAAPARRARPRAAPGGGAGRAASSRDDLAHPRRRARRASAGRRPRGRACPAAARPRRRRRRPARSARRARAGSRARRRRRPPVRSGSRRRAPPPAPSGAPAGRIHAACAATATGSGTSTSAPASPAPGPAEHLAPRRAPDGGVGEHQRGGPCPAQGGRGRSTSRRGPRRGPRRPRRRGCPAAASARHT